MCPSFFHGYFVIEHINYHMKMSRWRYMHSFHFHAAYIVIYILHLIINLPKITGFYQFRKVPIEHLRRVWIADRDAHSSEQLVNPSHLELA